jgi:allophanate hydrolase
MLADPIDCNAAMGFYTYFANPLDLCAVSVPGSGRADALPSSICVLAPAGADGRAHGVARDFEAAAGSAHRQAERLLEPAAVN